MWGGGSTGDWGYWGSDAGENVQSGKLWTLMAERDYHQEEYCYITACANSNTYKLAFL